MIHGVVVVVPGGGWAWYVWKSGDESTGCRSATSAWDFCQWANPISKKDGMTR